MSIGLPDDPRFRELVDRYLGQLPDRIGKMREALSDNQLQTAQQLAHQLKGSGGGYGFPGLSARAGAVERACLDLADVEKIAETIDLLEAEFQAILAARPAQVGS